MYWTSHKNASLKYFNQVLYGIRGTVTDSRTGKGLRAKVWVEDHDTNGDSSFVYSDATGGIGNYHRPIYEGTYNVTYSCEGCTSKTVSNIHVMNDSTSVVNVKLLCDNTVNASHGHMKLSHSIKRVESANIIVFILPTNQNNIKAQLFNLSGGKIRDVSSHNGKIKLSKTGISPGVYLLDIINYTPVRITVTR